MLIRLGIFIFGLLFVIRITKFNAENRVFETTRFEKMILLNIFLTVVVLIFIFDSAFLVWLSIFAGVFALLVTIFVTQKVREKEFRQDFVDYLDRVITFLRAGHGFLLSLDKANVETASQNQKKIQKLIESLQFSSQLQLQNEFLTEVFEEFTWIQKYPSKTLQRLVTFRRNLKTEEKFRRKSGRIVRQMMIQVIFLCVLYSLLLVFVGKFFGFSGNSKVIFVSLLLFIVGLLVFFYIGSKKLWKV